MEALEQLECDEIRRLLMEGDGLFSEVDASISGSEHEGFLMVNARLTDGSDAAIERARGLIDGQCRRLAVKGEVSAYELERCMNRFESNFRFSNMGYQARAASLAMAVYHGEDINDTVARQRRTTLADITSTADRLFNHTPSATLIVHPNTTKY